MANTTMRLQYKVSKYKSFPTFEYVEVGALPRQNYENESQKLWRVDYENGQARYWEEGSYDLEYNNQDWIRYSGSIEDYLVERGCKNVEEDFGDNRYTFEEVKA